ncbi:MAG: hypothetical protein NTY19_42265 [Planctomycetota bacterium]|nr:hypothetical protein [Planctomycetota bacterium]
MIKGILKQFPAAEQLARKLISLYPLSARLGRGFWAWYAFLQESESWTPEEHRAHQFQLLRALLDRLVQTSPFYARRLAGVPVRELNSIADLQKFVPPLSRMEFAENYRDILGRSLDHRATNPCSTSGTTGNAIQFVQPAEDRQREWASICHQWKRVGYDPARSHRAEFRGLTRQGALFQDFPDQNMVRLSILDLKADALPRMAEIISNRRARFFHGYPSAIYLLAQEILRNGLRFPQPEAVLLASEMVHGFQLEQIQAAFPNASLFAHYGCAEGTVLAAWCEHRRVYHALPQYSLVEVDGATGEIIGTNLHNDVNGFVRYRMTDTVGGVETAPCPACRRPYTPIITELDGRQEDYLYSRDRGWIAPAIVTYPLKHLRGIQELQFHQENPEEIILTYILRPGASDDIAAEELKKIEIGLREIIGISTRLHPRRVSEIPRGPTGKYKWIISKLDPATDRL